LAAAAVLAAALAVAGVITSMLLWYHIRRTTSELTERADRIDPDGRRSDVHRTADALHRLDVAIERMSVSATDVAARNEHATVALDSLPIGMIVVDTTGRELVRTRAAEHLVGVRASDALVGETMRQVLRGALEAQVVERTLDLFGPPRCVVAVTGRPVVRGDGAVVGAVATCEDVTERQRIEAARSDFVANLSHEIKTPVGAIAVLAETMAEDPSDTEVIHRFALRLVQESHRVNRIVNDLLELSRIEALGATRVSAVTVRSMVAEAVDRVRPLAEQRDVAIVISSVSTRATVLGDQRQLVSAVANLVENAVKYSDARSTVHIDARTDGRTVEIDVIDRGIGIPSRDLDRIFERFYRVDRARSRETGGTGLGLSIVRHIALNHEGSVHVRSTEGAGSTFTLRLPAGPGPHLVVGPPDQSTTEEALGA
jgi:two-component system, OmpR family, sensor histidine kinase SenX3